VASTAQQQSTSAAPLTEAPDTSTPTLHVYKSLLQVPVLVLRPNGDRIRTPIADKQFSVSLDSGPWFPATHVRLQGDDPIALSILLDTSGQTGSLMPKMAEGIANLAPGSLRPHDHLSVYALNCSLIGEASALPADSAALKQAVDGVLSSWTNRNSRKRGVDDNDCKQKEHLWDALINLTKSLHELPGRRVILVVSDGNDDGSVHTWNQVIEEAQASSVAIFGLKYGPETTTTSTENPLNSRSEYGISTETASAALDKENLFRKLCELTGATAKLTSPGTLKARLKELTAMVRERYIVEFPRPLNGKPGWHAITVRIDQGNYFVRSAGITFPLMSREVLADPTTIHSDPSLAPSLGPRTSPNSPQ
jgi:VWFA-related protein